MTVPAQRAGQPIALPADAGGFAELVGKVDWVVVTEDLMVEAGVDPSIAHMFIAYFATDGRVPLSELATHITSRHRDWRPAAIKTSHFMLYRSALVPQEHHAQRCGICQSFMARA